MATITVNGKPTQTERDMPLIDYLRDVLRLTSVKNGCGEGACGACMVLINGLAMRACLQTLSRVDGKSVITVEGLKRDLQSYTEKLVALKQKHQGRAGQVVSSDEYSYCMSVGLEYMSMNEEIRALLFQPLTTLTEYANVALQQLNAQNPDVVTDVVTKEAV